MNIVNSILYEIHDNFHKNECILLFMDNNTLINLNQKN